MNDFRGSSRRSFLANVGRGMLIGSVGSGLVLDLGISSADAGEDIARLSFGDMDPLVSLMQETPLDRLLPRLVQEHQSGTSLKTLIAAGALANAQTFGGQDYIGYHTLMALVPALHMSGELPTELSALPVLKVLYRNTQQIHAAGGVASEKLHPLADSDVAPDQVDLIAAVGTAEFEDAERAFSSLRGRTPKEMFEQVLPTVHEHPDVHRVVLAWRSYAMVDITGEQNAHTLLRQSIRYAVAAEQYRNQRNQPAPEIRSLLPALLDQHHLLGRAAGDKPGDDAWLDELANTILTSSPRQAAEAVAQAIADGYKAEHIGEAMSLAANLLLLQDPGRSKYTNELKPAGSVHGDSVGVHASDSANAWRNIVRATSHQSQVASMIVGAYHTAGQRSRVGDTPWPLAEHLAAVKSTTASNLLNELDEAVRAKDQPLSCAVVTRYAEKSDDVGPVFARLIRYATSEDGALHAEKFYRTVHEEFRTTRASRRWRHVIALARVSASEYGRRAEGYEQAVDLLGIKPPQRSRPARRSHQSSDIHVRHLVYPGFTPNGTRFVAERGESSGEDTENGVHSPGGLLPMALGLALYLVCSPGFSRNWLAIPGAIPPKGGTTNLNQVPLSLRRTAENPAKSGAIGFTPG